MVPENFAGNVANMILRTVLPCPAAASTWKFNRYGDDYWRTTSHWSESENEVMTSALQIKATRDLKENEFSIVQGSYFTF